jgi:hypothetical protein
MADLVCAALLRMAWALQLRMLVTAPSHRPFALLVLALLASSCATSTGDGAFVDHEEASDFEDSGSDERSDGLGPTFNRNNVMSDDFFRAVNAINRDDLQRFFEESPYMNRSWLADATVHGRRAADAIFDASVSRNINPLVMLGRMQVEKGLISKTVTPSQNTIDFAFGCGCSDGSSCLEQFRGLDKQIECAADTLDVWFKSSQDGTGEWRVGHTEQTLDPISIRPQNHATASLYSYTPWVLQGQGGNWLVWNVTRKFEQHAKALGVLHLEPEATLEADWSRRDDGSYDLSAQAPSDVVKVRYFVDGIVIGEALRTDGSDFQAHRVFNSEGPDRPFEVRGYNAVGTWVAFGNGRMDVGSTEGVYIRQTDTGEYEVGLERARADVAAIEVKVNDISLRDIVSASEHSSRLVIRSGIAAPGESFFQILLFNSSGQVLRTYERDLVVR